MTPENIKCFEIVVDERVPLNTCCVKRLVFVQCVIYLGYVTISFPMQAGSTANVDIQKRYICVIMWVEMIIITIIIVIICREGPYEDQKTGLPKHFEACRAKPGRWWKKVSLQEYQIGETKHTPTESEPEKKWAMCSRNIAS